MTATTFSSPASARAFEDVLAQGRLTERERETFESLFAVNELYGRHPYAGSVALYVALARGHVGSDASAEPDRIALLAVDQPAPPVGGDDAVQALDREVQTFAADQGLDYWYAFARRVGNPDVALDELPPWKPEEFNVDPERAELDRRARDAARRLQVGYVDAVAVVQLDDELADAEADTGRGDVPWLDTSTARPPQPYGEQSLEDWERDKLRAKAAGVQVVKDWWQQAAEEGRDLVYEMAVEARQARVRELRARRDALLEQARGVERTRRQSALDGELDKRARERLAPGPTGPDSRPRAAASRASRRARLR
jgi:hypothetical protein